MIPIWAFYGAAAAVTVLLAMASRHYPSVKLSAILLTSWFVTRLADELLGYHYGPRVFVVLDATLGLYAAWVAFRSRDLVAAMVFALFLAMGAEHLAAFSLGDQGSYRYFLVLNVLYALQLSFVAGGAGVRLIAHRPDRAVSGAHRISRPVLGGS